MAETTGPSWSDIPVDLAGRILRRLPAHVDRLRFAAVCPEWRAAARLGPLSPPLPLLLLPDSTVYSLPGSKTFHFPASAGYTNACSAGNWLVFSGEDDCFLRDPFSKETITLPDLSRAQFRRVDDESSNEADHTWIIIEEEMEVDISRVVFCSPHLIAAIFKFTPGDRFTRIAVCQPGASSLWSIYESHQAPLFVDIVFHQGKLYALDCHEGLFAVAISIDHGTGDPWVSQIQQVIGGCQVFHGSQAFLYNLVRDVRNERLTFLVESHGALLLVCRKIDICLNKGCWHAIEALEVYEGNFGQSQWAMVTTLGDDQVLFLSRQCCRSFNISHIGMPGDRIFFMDNDDESYLGYKRRPLVLAESTI